MSGSLKIGDTLQQRRVRELPVAYLPREGRSKVTGTLRGTLRAIRDMTRVLATAGAK